MDKITKRKGHKHKNQPNRKLTKKYYNMSGGLDTQYDVFVEKMKKQIEFPNKVKTKKSLFLLLLSLFQKMY